jgi:hypothetical protein
MAALSFTRRGSGALAHCAKSARAVAVVISVTVVLVALLSPGRLGAQSPIDTPRYQEVLSRARNLVEYVEDVTNSERDYQDVAYRSIQECDRETFEQALQSLEDLRRKLETYKAVVLSMQGQLQSLADEVQSGSDAIRRASEGFERPTPEQWTRLLQSSIQALRQLLPEIDNVDTRISAEEDKLREQWQQQCNRPAATVQPGAEVAKGDIVLVDERTQQQIGGGQVFIIPQDPKQPIRPIPVRPDGHATIPQIQPGDRVVFIPQCHQKVELAGASLESGAQISVRQHPLQLQFNDMTCAELHAKGGEALVNQALEDQYGVRMPKMDGTSIPPLWVTEEHNMVDGNADVHPYCVVTVNWYEPVKPPDEKQACAVPSDTRIGGDTPGPTRPDGGRTIPKNGETTIDDGGRTVIVDGNQPREIQ